MGEGFTKDCIYCGLGATFQAVKGLREFGTALVALIVIGAILQNWDNIIHLPWRVGSLLYHSIAQPVVMARILWEPLSVIILGLLLVGAVSAVGLGVLALMGKLASKANREATERPGLPLGPRRHDVS